MKCYHHLNREATHIANLGTQIDLDTPVCDKCAKAIMDGKAQGINPNATIVKIETPLDKGE